MHDRLPLTLDPGRVTRRLAVLALLLVLANMYSAWRWTEGSFLGFQGQDNVEYKYLTMFDLDEEEGFGTWFAAITLLFAGRLLLLITKDSRRGQDGLWGWWLVLAVGFHLLSVDEVAGMHEWLNSHGEVFGFDETWTTYAVQGVGAVALSFLPFLLLLWKKGHARLVGLLVIACIFYVGGAVGAEHFSPSRDDFATREAFNEALNSLSYNMGWISLEEGLEMTGVITLIYALLDYMRKRRDQTVHVEVFAGPR